MPIHGIESKKQNNNDESIIIFYSIRISGNTRRDLDNAAQSINDSLVSSGKIKDDSYKQIKRQFIGYEKVEPGEEGFDLVIIHL